MRVKMHKEACNKGYTGKFATAQHVWVWQHCMNCDDALDRATRRIQLLMKNVLCIQIIPVDSKINHDEL